MELVKHHDVLQFKNAIFDCIDVTENTRKEYLSRIKHFIHFVKLHGINSNTYLEYKRYLSAIDTLSVPTKNKYLISAKIFIDGLNNLQQLPFQINTKVRGFKQSKLHKKDWISKYFSQKQANGKYFNPPDPWYWFRDYVNEIIYRDIKTTQRYARVNNDKIASDMKKLSTRISDKYIYVE